MSISVGHRAIFTAFGHRGSAPVGAHAPSRQAQTPVPAETTVPLDGGELKCSPWEGLYLEQAQPLTRKGSDPVLGGQLDGFLASLMYGE
ncbi:MAG TPA: hypothetical protein VJ617_05030 [Arthrobacter sp.]|nr:hypothetical protein [Arthrobacter sp.]